MMKTGKWCISLHASHHTRVFVTHRDQPSSLAKLKLCQFTKEGLRSFLAQWTEKFVLWRTGYMRDRARASCGQQRSAREWSGVLHAIHGLGTSEALLGGDLSSVRLSVIEYRVGPHEQINRTG